MQNSAKKVPFLSYKHTYPQKLNYYVVLLSAIANNLHKATKNK
ncbi:hypothetical protein Phi14:2_gp122 [Cellulophaga phage phi14:2]|uniref:Uncharacterized protein n=1 Tax=Cellulophaga phage phi14:2 TaxID=1327990 RepID=S0A2H1_9CAUD|nr:hypothetical protein Phi14:2_gp122 [Cellulophaga phage phi14:2]